MVEPLSEQDATLLELLQWLAESGYRFVAPTPRTHAIVLARDPARDAHSPSDILGWNRPFRPGSIDAVLDRLLNRAGVIETVGDCRRSTVRVATLDDRLFLHSAFPTSAPDSVFFGPDSYRFARFITACLTRTDAQSIVDVGTGSGVGGIVAARSFPGASVAMTDINPAALRLARINAAAAGISPALHLGDILADITGEPDVVIANPPYIMDSQRRAYRDGGGLQGSELSLRMVREVLGRLAPDGRLLLYTGSAIVDGRDQFRHLAEEAAAMAGCLCQYDEIDPDVFGEELEQPAYVGVDRIAAVGVVFTRS